MLHLLRYKNVPEFVYNLECVTPGDWLKMANNISINFQNAFPGIVVYKTITQITKSNTTKQECSTWNNTINEQNPGQLSNSPAKVAYRWENIVEEGPDNLTISKHASRYRSSEMLSKQPFRDGPETST